MKRKMAECNLCEPFIKIKEKHEEMCRGSGNNATRITHIKDEKQGRHFHCTPFNFPREENEFLTLLNTCLLKMNLILRQGSY